MAADVGQGFAVCLCNPQGFAHAGALREVAETLHWGLVDAGFESTHVENQFLEGRLNIVMAPHLLVHFPGWDSRGTENMVLFNFEQIREELIAQIPYYPSILARCRVWDYDRRNVDALKALGVERVQHVRVGFAAQMTRVDHAADQDIDVLFYGSPSARRLKLRDELLARGLVTEFVFGVYGAQRDAMISRAKLVVNPGVYETGGLFDIVRLSYLLTNRKAVVMEKGIDPEQEARFDAGVCFATIDEMADECVYLCAVEDERRELADRGYALFSATPQGGLMKSAIAGLGEP